MKYNLSFGQFSRDSTNEMQHFFVFAAPKFACLWKSAYFCPRHKEKLEKMINRDPVIYEVDAIKNNITMVRIAFILMFFMLLCSKNCSAQEEMTIDLEANEVVKDSCDIEFPVYKIKCNSLKDYIKKVIEDDMQKSSDGDMISHVTLYFFNANDNSFKVVAQFHSRKRAYLSSAYYGVAFVNNIPVFICGDTPFILKPLKKKESYKKTQENNYLIIDPLTEIFLYRKATKSFIRIG